MSRSFVGASNDKMTCTNPQGASGLFNVTGSWTVLLWINPTLASLNTYFAIGDASFTRGFESYIGATGQINLATSPSNHAAGVNALATSTFTRIMFNHDGAGNYTTNINGTQDNSFALGAPSAIQTGDALILGLDRGIGISNFTGALAWLALLEGIVLTATAADNYLNSTGGKTPCSLETDYGRTGGISAHKLAGLWGLGTGLDTDYSERANNFTLTGTSNSAMPGGAPASCSFSSVKPAPQALFRTQVL